MPLKKCQTNGKPGYKYGDSGNCYLKKADALKQMVAIKISQGEIKPKRKR